MTPHLHRVRRVPKHRKVWAYYTWMSFQHFYILVRAVPHSVKEIVLYVEMHPLVCILPCRYIIKRNPPYFFLWYFYRADRTNYRIASLSEING